VRGLDDILGGGIPEFSFNLIGGTPGCGKTTLVHQIAFANATPEKPALYFTVLGEPAIKMLRYQQQFTFFDESKVGKSVRFVNLSDLMLDSDLKTVQEEIIAQVSAANAGIVVVDSFRSLARKAISELGELEVQSFVHRLAQFFFFFESKSFLFVEYVSYEIFANFFFIVSFYIVFFFFSFCFVSFF
jgi:circadian clock protein KaiC